MDTPELESMNVDEIKNNLAEITEETTKEDLHKKIDFFVKQLNQAYEMNKRNTMVLIEALEKAQSQYKKYEREQGSFKNRFKKFIKRVLISWGWYEASYDELKEIHFGKAGNHIPQKG
jgi:hypothetical protein